MSLAVRVVLFLTNYLKLEWNISNVKKEFVLFKRKKKATRKEDVKRKKTLNAINTVMQVSSSVVNIDTWRKLANQILDKKKLFIPLNFQVQTLGSNGSNDSLGG